MSPGGAANGSTHQPMKRLVILLPIFLQSLAASESSVNHQDALANYVQKLNTHAWDQIAPLVADDAVFIFSEGTFIGKNAAQAAFEKTFRLIQDGEYSIDEISWTVEREGVASCHYEFRWKGMIDGSPAAGGGRGTSILINVDGKWLVAHEHLGPHPRK